MLNVVNPKLANGRAMFINKASGSPAPSRRAGAVSVRPGLGTIKLYLVKHIDDVGTLVMMSDGNKSRFYLFAGLFRGTFLSEHHCDTYSDGLTALFDELEVPRTQTMDYFRNRVWKWLEKEIRSI